MPPNTEIIAKGSCLCKSVTYKITGQPRASVLCYCSHCQKTSGSAMGAFLNFAEDDVSLSDPSNVLRWYESKSDSGRSLQRSFCSTCGSSLVLKSDSQDGMTVSFGTLDLDDVKERGLDELWKPTMELFCERKRGWVPEFGGIKSFERMFPSNGV